MCFLFFVLCMLSFRNITDFCPFYLTFFQSDTRTHIHSSIYGWWKWNFGDWDCVCWINTMAGPQCSWYARCFAKVQQQLIIIKSTVFTNIAHKKFFKNVCSSISQDPSELGKDTQGYSQLVRSCTIPGVTPTLPDRKSSIVAPKRFWFTLGTAMRINKARVNIVDWKYCYIRYSTHTDYIAYLHFVILNAQSVSWGVGLAVLQFLRLSV